MTHQCHPSSAGSLKPVPGGRIWGRVYNRRAWPEANCAVSKPERSNEDLTNRWHDRILEAVPGFRSPAPLRNAKIGILLITSLLLRKGSAVIYQFETLCDAV